MYDNGEYSLLKILRNNACRRTLVFGVNSSDASVSFRKTTTSMRKTQGKESETNEF